MCVFKIYSIVPTVALIFCNFISLFQLTHTKSSITHFNISKKDNRNLLYAGIYLLLYLTILYYLHPLSMSKIYKGKNPHCPFWFYFVCKMPILLCLIKSKFTELWISERMIKTNKQKKIKKQFHPFLFFRKH